MNNILFFMDEPFGKNQNQQRDMQEMRDAQDSIPWDAMVPRGLTDNVARQIYEPRAEPKTGKEFLGEAGVKGPVGAVFGAVMDATLDPLMTPSKTWGGLAVDYGLGTAHGTIPVAVEAAEAIRKLRDRYATPY
jgi:hypothetical protein